MTNEKQGIMKVSTKRSSNTVDATSLRLYEANERVDFGGLDIDTVFKICNPDTDLSNEEIQSIKETVEQGSLSDDKSLHWLVKNIAENGVRSEMSGFYSDGVVYVNSGNRRTLAVWINIRIYNVNIQGVPLKAVSQSANEGTMMVDRYLENKGRKDLNPLEEAKALEKMVKYFGGVEAVCQKVTIEQWKLEQKLSLLSLTPAAQEIVGDGDVKFRPIIAAIKEAAVITDDIVERSNIVSKAIVQAKAENQGENKGRVTASDIKAKLPKIENLDKEALLSELRELLGLDAVIDALDASYINNIVKQIKKKTQA